MKSLLIIVLLSLVGCAQLTNSGGGSQTVKVIDLKQKLMNVTCSGLVDTWADCIIRARAACINGYDEGSRVESTVGARRELIFKCK